jgi:hypothetical protein
MAGKSGASGVSLRAPQLNAGERLNAFDPEASEIILVPQMRGG